ncbi:MAG: hypothetical protein C0621_00690 [Desulfuromonas sp.]|nr:MAG: hypothetical protein C0621_00690 [Desulfuromonas sp.]
MIRFTFDISGSLLLWLLFSLLLHGSLLFLTDTAVEIRSEQGESVSPVVVRLSPFMRTVVTEPAPLLPPASPRKVTPRKTEPSPPKAVLSPAPIPTTPAPQPKPADSKAPPEPLSLPQTLPVAQTTVVSNKPVRAEKKGGEASAPSSPFIPPRYDKTHRPHYPEVARKRGWEGTVTLKVTVSSRGEVENVEIRHSSTFPLLDSSAKQAVEKWRFYPARQNGSTVAGEVIVPVRFSLRQRGNK